MRQRCAQCALQLGPMCQPWRVVGWLLALPRVLLLVLLLALPRVLLLVLLLALPRVLQLGANASALEGRRMVRERVHAHAVCVCEA